ncbi:nucleotidyltransferase family protein [Vreelandella populi]|uniref:Nucleotidyltransferase family protein n=1 Tax=Vreelandella populi TaxID=2498858 RepID=A0A433LEE4_9GAMM|nr:nucleotidyltransferase family protein [Halomonas populi]RUR35594.1 nucleotidyltransferase family protein [Halomonas populi]RUR47785.1 nucleotidyltransferase family protein [Halomonas populi]
MSSSRVAALLMAAGYSRRFGPDDKRCALLPDGHSLLATSAANAQKAFTHLRVAVREEDDPALLGLPKDVTLVRVREANLGLGASLAEAVGIMSHDSSLDDIDAVAILLGDMPYLETGTLLALQRQASRDTIVRPCFEGRPGHPVIFGRTMWPALERLSGGDGAKSVIKQYASRLRECPVADAGILRDIDAPADLPGLFS